MQRSITNKNPLRAIGYLVLFIIYTALSGVYIMLPPLLGVLYFLFSKTLHSKDTMGFVLVLIALVFLEAKSSYLIFSTIIYFGILYRYVMPKVKQSLNCNFCVNILLVIFAYVGFFLFLSIVANIFVLEEPCISYNIIYFMMIEFMILSLF